MFPQNRSSLFKRATTTCRSFRLDPFFARLFQGKAIVPGIDGTWFSPKSKHDRPSHGPFSEASRSRVAVHREATPPAAPARSLGYKRQVEIDDVDEDEETRRPFVSRGNWKRVWKRMMMRRKWDGFEHEEVRKYHAKSEVTFFQVFSKFQNVKSIYFFIFERNFVMTSTDRKFLPLGPVRN